MSSRVKKREASLTTKNVNNGLSKVNHRWEEIGNELDIASAAIYNIERNKKGNVNLCTLGLVDHWLRTDIRATWEKLAQALETLGENGAASEIREKYIPDSISYSNSEASSVTTSSASSSAGQPRVVPDGPGLPQRGNQEVEIQELIGSSQEEGKMEKMVRMFSEGSELRLDELDQHGCTLVHHCAKKGDLEALKVLVALGADVNTVDRFRFTPLDAANYAPNGANMAEFLREVGGVEANVMMMMEQSPLSKRPRRSLDEEEQKLRGLMVSDGGCESDGLVLCLDSSSTMAVLQLECLGQLERVTRRPVKDLFSWVVASGVGGFLMLAMVYCGFDLDKLRRLYFRIRDRIFCGLQKQQRGVALKDLAVEVFKDKKMNSVQAVKLLIGAVNKESTVLQPKFFTNYDSSLDEVTRSVWEVACYTCSTPDFIGEKDQYVDGGTISKNPSVFALGHILDQCRKVGTSVGGLVSLGDGQYPGMPMRELDSSNMSMFNDSVKNALAKEVSGACSRLCQALRMHYYRFSPLLYEYVHQPEGITLDMLVETLLITVKQLQNEEDLKDFGRRFC